jgi:hypothetical protein
MKFRGHAAIVLTAIFMSVLMGCAGTPATGGSQLSLMELPITFNEADVAREPATDSSVLTDDPAADKNDIDSFDDEHIPATVIARGVSIRKSPGTRSASMGKIPKGTGLDVIEIREDGWCHVETHEGERGYIWAPLLNIKGRKFKTARYKGMRHILVSSNYYLGPDGVKRSRLEVRGLDFKKPLKSIKLTSRYGIRKRHPVNGGRNKMHQGVDLKARVGTAVRAAASGVVKSVRRGSNYGKYVDIKHKLGFTTRYAHLSRALVYKGQRVKAGQLIARSGNTGATTGPHLHFELHKRGRSVNPIRHISALR